MPQDGAAPAGDVIFELKDVTFSYNQEPALDHLDLRIYRGQRVALLGANGSGKSTLMRLLDALYFPDSGSVTAFDDALTEAQFEDDAFAIRFRRRVGFVFQNADVQLFNPTVFDEIAFGPLQLGWPREQIRSRVTEILREMDLTHLKDRSPHRLSGGEKKRVALASVLIVDPEVLLLDEPTAGLDPESQSQVIDLLVGWAGSSKTVITATHDLDTVEDIADICVVLKAGKVIADGRPSDILKDEELLQRTRLIHAHRHIHPDGRVHRHHHLHVASD